MFLALLRPLVPAILGLTCAGEEGPGQILWVVEPREHAWGGGPAKQVQLCANLQLVGVQLHLQGDRVCSRAVCRGLATAPRKASTGGLDYTGTSLAALLRNCPCSGSPRYGGRKGSFSGLHLRQKNQNLNTVCNAWRHNDTLHFYVIAFNWCALYIHRIFTHVIS